MDFGIDLGKEKSKVVALDGLRFDLVVTRYADGRVFASARAEEIISRNRTKWMSEKIANKDK